MEHISASTNGMHSCIETCSHCHQTCLQTAMNHCLTTGGKHVEPEHFRLMMSCAQICQATACLQLSGSIYCEKLCEVCAAVCEECAVSCERISGMEACVQACRDCAKCCHSMAGASH